MTTYVQTYAGHVRHILLSGHTLNSDMITGTTLCQKEVWWAAYEDKAPVCKLCLKVQKKREASK
jgi:hypothetical protein